MSAWSDCLWWSVKLQDLPLRLVSNWPGNWHVPLLIALMKFSLLVVCPTYGLFSFVRFFLCCEYLWPFILVWICWIWLEHSWIQARVILCSDVIVIRKLPLAFEVPWKGWSLVSPLPCGRLSDGLLSTFTYDFILRVWPSCLFWFLLW